VAGHGRDIDASAAQERRDLQWVVLTTLDGPASTVLGAAPPLSVVSTDWRSRIDRMAPGFVKGSMMIE
jgi:hypothetical protein